MIRVLIADDQALVRAGFRALLDAQEGIEVVGEAADGEEAVRLARTLRPDVVLMDIRMPGLDGLEATKTIAAHIQTMPQTIPHPIYAVTWAPGGKQILTASYDKSLKLWDVAAGTLVKEFKAAPDPAPGAKVEPPKEPVGHRDQVFSAVFTKDGKQFATGSSDRTVKLWDVAAGKVIRDFPNPDQKSVLPGEPAPSHPGMSGSGYFTPGMPRRTHRSRWLTDAARSSTRTSPGPGVGRATWRSSSRSRPPCAAMTMAIKRVALRCRTLAAAPAAPAASYLPQTYARGGSP